MGKAVLGLLALVALHACSGSDAATPTSQPTSHADGGAALDAGSGAGNDAAPSACVPTHTLAPSADESVALGALLVAAAAEPEVEGIRGRQGRVYLGPGVHRFHDVAVPSNVRIEVDPGATLTAVAEAPTGDKQENPLFTLGAETEVHDITITAGDGCGGPGVATLANKLATTGDRGNTEANGMSNMAIPHDPYWPIATFFVFDVDPHFRNVPSGTFGVRVGWTTDVSVSRFFSIQNPERVTDASGKGTGPTVNYIQNPVIKPRALRDSTFAAPHLPTRFDMEWVYNVLSPSGWGPVQVQACVDCTFAHVFSHGGVALRFETDNAAPTCGHDVCDGCTVGATTVPPVDDQGHGLSFYARVDTIEASDIETALGNSALYLQPHCQRNGRVHVKGIRGSNSASLVSIGEGGKTDGTFDPMSLVEDVVATNLVAGKAEDANPQLNTYDLVASRVAMVWTPTAFTARTAGTFCWPASLQDLVRPASAEPPVPVPTFQHDACPARAATR